ncbi:hypothetical protein BLOT_011648 [Blomia tropicalis]|nr:hypothetical protein BLOT_011648 [Blomia tropicalis]
MTRMNGNKPTEIKQGDWLLSPRMMTPRYLWPLVQIQQPIFGSDGICRSASILPRCGSIIMKILGPISAVLLPSSEEAKMVLKRSFLPQARGSQSNLLEFLECSAETHLPSLYYIRYNVNTKEFKNLVNLNSQITAQVESLKTQLAQKDAEIEYWKKKTSLKVH